MYARNVRMQLKPNSVAEFTRTLETQIIPMLRKHKGFQDEIAFVFPNGREATATSLWDLQENAEDYNKRTYPEVLKTLAKVVEGTPQVELGDVSNSTFHKIAAVVTVYPVGPFARWGGGGLGRLSPARRIRARKGTGH